MATVNGISFWELEGSPSLHISSRSGMTAVRRFGVAWDDWESFALALIGVHSNVGGSVRQVAPPRFPGISDRLFVSDLKIDPFDGANPDGSQVTTLTSGTNRYPGDNFAVVVATYSMQQVGHPDKPDTPDGTYLSYEEDLGAEYLTIPGRTWKWPDGSSLPDDATAGVLIPKGNFTLAWHRVVRPPWLAIDLLRGCTNNAPFLGRAAGTVLFLGARIKRQFQFIEDDGYWLVEYQFATDAKRLSNGSLAGWNAFYNRKPIAGEHWQTITDQSGNTPYHSAGFATLFQYG